MADSRRDQERFLPSPSYPDSPIDLSPSLAQHYIPDKLAHQPTSWGNEARKASRVATGGWGAAAGRRVKGGNGGNSGGGRGGLFTILSKSNNDERGNGVLFKPKFHHLNDGSFAYSSSVASTPFSSSNVGSSDPTADPFRSPSVTVMGPPSSGHRNRKSGAGRSAWGKDGGGNAALGAGDYEDDDGLDLSHDSYPARAARVAAVTAGRARAESSSEDQQHLNETSSRKSLIPRLIGLQLPPRATRAKWNHFKWTLVVLNTVLTIYSFVGFVALLLVWAGMYKETKVLVLVNRIELILAMVAMCFCLISAYLGWAGLLLNNRSFLGIYLVLLWISFIFIVAPGYLAYKQRTFNLSGKINQIWSRQLSANARRTVQVTLNCCGYYSPFIEAAADGFRCFSRSLLPGCKGSLFDFQRKTLQYIYVCSFTIVPVHLLLIAATLLSADHITYRFGKGVTPKEYRVDDQVIQQALQQQSCSPSHQNSFIQDGATDGKPTLSHPRPPFWQTKTGSTSSAH